MKNQYVFMIYKLDDEMNKTDITITTTREEAQLYLEYLKKKDPYYCEQLMRIEIVKTYNSKFYKICENCGESFIATDSKEVYCDRKNEKGKTCKQVGYANKLKKNEVLNFYYKQYRNRNGKKNRNKGNNFIVNKYNEWDKAAKAKAKEYKKGLITEKEFKTWLENN